MMMVCAKACCRIIIIILCSIITVPVVLWDDREVDIPEGGNREVCFSSDIGTVQSYNVIVGARQKGANPAIRSMYICILYVGEIL